MSQTFTYLSLPPVINISSLKSITKVNIASLCLFNSNNYVPVFISHIITLLSSEPVITLRLSWLIATQFILLVCPIKTFI